MSKFTHQTTHNRIMSTQEAVETEFDSVGSIMSRSESERWEERPSKWRRLS